MTRFVPIVAAALLFLAAGVLAWVRDLQTITELEPDDLRFGETNNLGFDPDTGTFEVLGPDPFTYLELPSHSIPLLELRLDFEGPYQSGGWYVYPCPAHLPNPIINQDWVVTAQPQDIPDGHALIWTLEDSQLARIDFPDELTQPMRLQQVVLTTNYVNSRSPVYVGAMACSAIGALIVIIQFLRAFVGYPIVKWGAVAALIAGKLAIARNLGQTFMLQFAHDDRLFMDQGRSILAGDWLGVFNQLTLAKGPTFSVFLALSAASGWPLQTNVLLLHAVACLVFVVAVSPWVTKPRWQFLLFAFLLLDPHSMSAELIGRVLRSAVQPALTLLTMAGLVGMVARAHRSWIAVLPWSLLTGVAGAAFWYSREEGIWLLPSALLLTATAGVLAWRRENKSWAVLAVIAVLPFCVFSGAKSALRAVNHHHYGVWMGVDVLEGNFPAAYGAILRVENPDPLSGVAVTQATRRLIYAESPTFALIEEHMEGAVHKKWAFADWHRQPPHPRAGTEIRGGWFQWALRDAVELAGFYESAEKAERFWQDVADEINAAVDEGRLQGGGARHGFMPVWHNRYLLPTASGWLRAVDLIVRSKDFKAKGIPSRGSPAEIQEMAEAFNTTAVVEVGPNTWDTNSRMAVRQIYYWAGWPLTLVALFATGVLAYRARRDTRNIALVALLLAFWGGVTSLALVVSLVEATSFTAIIGAYLGPAAPLIMVTWVVAPYFAWVQKPDTTTP